MAPQLQINQGPEDALLFDNSRSYFTNVGYVRTSNFQMELRDVDPQNTAMLGGTVQFVIPKTADLLGPMDLMIEFNQAENPPNTTLAPDGAYWGWVESVGYAMIEKLTFSIGSHDVETLTGDHLNMINELMRNDTHRYGFKQTLKTGRSLVKADTIPAAAAVEITVPTAEVSDSTGAVTVSPRDYAITPAVVAGKHYYVNSDLSTDSYDRLIAYNPDGDTSAATGTTNGVVKEGKKLIIPLGL